MKGHQGGASVNPEEKVGPNKITHKITDVVLGSPKCFSLIPEIFAILIIFPLCYVFCTFHNFPWSMCHH